MATWVTVALSVAVLCAALSLFVGAKMLWRAKLEPAPLRRRKQLRGGLFMAVGAVLIWNVYNLSHIAEATAAMPAAEARP